MNQGILLCLVVCVSGVISQTPCNYPPPTPPSYWVANLNCQNGYTYKTTTNGQQFQCHCWGLCGYLCDPPGSRTTTTTTRPSSTGSSGTGSTSASTTTTTQKSLCQILFPWKPSCLF